MISVCSSVYRETDALEIFVRSIIQQASKPSEVEVIIINDGAYEPTTQVLENLSKEFPQLKYFNRTQQERIDFILKNIKFYEDNKIFNKEIIDDMQSVVGNYEKGIVKKLWFPPGELFNLAVSKSKGDVLMICPSDYFCTFDISLLYQRYLEVKNKEDSFIGFFDWLDFTSLEPMPDILGFLRKEKNITSISGFTNSCLNQIESNGLTIIRGQHGTRLIDRKSFDEIGGFDGRWFLRAWNDDYFNEKLKKFIPPTWRLMDRMQFIETNAFVGALREKFDTPNTYLTQYYVPSEPRIHARFLDAVKLYLSKEEKI